MSNVPYDAARFRMLTANLDWNATNLVLTAWGGTPLFNPAHQTIANVKSAGGVEIGSSLPVTATSVAASGVAQTNQIVIPDVPVGPDVTWFTMAQRGMPLNNSSLLLFIDEALDLPFVPNGLDMVVTPDWLAEKGWFRP